jgi:hypothetical protein
MALGLMTKNRLLNKLLRNRNFSIGSVWVSLHAGDPGTVGADELSGRGYERQQGSFNDAAEGRAHNNVTMDYEDLPESDVAGFGLWDSKDGEGSLFLGGGIFLDVQHVPPGNTYRIPIGNLDISLE